MNISDKVHKIYNYRKFISIGPPLIRNKKNSSACNKLQNATSPELTSILAR